MHSSFFKTSLILSLGLALGISGLVGPERAFAQETIKRAEAADPDGEEILKLVRMSRALQDFKSLTGKLRNDRGKTVIPIEFTMTDGVIRFLLKNPNEILHLDLGEAGTSLRRIADKTSVELPVALYGERIRDTAINYEDLSMRFLYWPKPRVLGEATVTYMKCWIVRVTNPDGRGPYGTVDVWVHKDSGAVAQMHAYDRFGKKVKAFMVRKGQKFKGTYILKQMRIEEINPENQKVLGRTYLEIDDPE